MKRIAQHKDLCSPLAHTRLGQALLLAFLLTGASGSSQSGEPSTPVASAPSKPAPDDDAAALAKLSLEDLMKVKVTSVAKRDQSLSEAAAAVFVLSQKDLERSGFTTIADALRLVPGLQVARENGYEWAVAARGFADVFANKLLVMMDGRSVYTPLFSGVQWQVQDTLLEDIDQIEIVRGPGASLWGANAVNGIIHIHTKSASETQGTLLSGGGGMHERAFAAARYGGRISENAHYRVYGKYNNRDNTDLTSDTRANDSWDMWRGGFRVDWNPADPNQFTFQGDAYDGTFQETATFTDTSGGGLVPTTYSAPISMSGQNVLARWSHAQGASASFDAQVYFDRTRQVGARIQEERNTVDVDLQQSLELGEMHRLMAGLGYRLSSDQLGSNFDITWSRTRRNLQLFSAFLQDEITLVPEHLTLTLGSKLEHNDFTGVEVQPSVRVMWTPSRQHSLWAAVSRAVRTPSRAERDVRLNFVVDPAPIVLSYVGNQDLESEQLIAYEAGHRWQATPTLSLDTTFFYNTYDNLRIVPFFAGGPDPSIPAAVAVQRNRMSNQGSGEVYGSEVAATWRVTEVWRLRPSYSLLLMNLHRDPGVGDISDEQDEGRSPVHQASMHSSLDLPANVTWDTLIRYVDRLAASGVGSYVGLDVRLAWKPRPWVEVSVVGQNLLENNHPEFKGITFQTQNTEVSRTVYGKITFRF